LVKRQAFGTESRETDMIGLIHINVFFQDRYMLNEVNARIEFIRNNYAFYLIATSARQFKVLITAE
jgi:hypothetical protein